MSSKVELKTVQADGLNIFYRESGPSTAPVILLLHGFPELAFSWRKVILPLTNTASASGGGGGGGAKNRTYHVVAPDQRGFGRTTGWVAAAGVLTAIGAAVTVSSTAMIYASLKPIPQWSSPFTVPGYLVLSATSGLVILNALLRLFGQPSTLATAAAIVFALISSALKLGSWRYNDGVAMPATLNSATGLAGGRVRSIEWPHTEENYLLKEMGFRVARKHALKLRLVAQVLAFLLPAGLLLAGLLLGGTAATVAAVLAVLCQVPGFLVERWLFFAEAKHTVTLYYGRA